jgi:vacuolar-type H+-ATPase subunit I/STV1
MSVWRALVWTGVVASVLAWGLAWFTVRGAAVVMLFVALAAVVLAYRSERGEYRAKRMAVVGLMVAGFAMFMAALYWSFLLIMPPAVQVPVFEWFASSGFPMLAAAVLLVGAVPGYRHISR